MILPDNDEDLIKLTKDELIIRIRQLKKENDTLEEQLGYVIDDEWDAFYEEWNNREEEDD